MRIDFIAAHPNNYYQGRGGNSIQYIVVHYTANDGDTAAGNGNYFSGANRQASAHYFVDECSVVQTVKDTDAAWHCGGGLQGSGGHAYYGKCQNRNSLGVEMCSDKVGGKYVITAATVDRTVELVRYLMKRHNVPASRVIRHYDVTGKICPEPWVRNESLWTAFKARLEDDDMSYEQFKAYMSQYQKEQEAKPVSNYAKGGWEKAKADGVTDGTAPQGVMTREMGVVMMQRAGVIGK